MEEQQNHWMSRIGNGDNFKKGLELSLKRGDYARLLKRLKHSRLK